MTGELGHLRNVVALGKSRFKGSFTTSSLLVKFATYRLLSLLIGKVQILLLWARQVIKKDILIK